MKFTRILKISRPQLWIYELGAFTIGILAAYICIYVSDTPPVEPISLIQIELAVLFFIYFTFPANLLLYGTNDIFDYEIDIKNERRVAEGTVVEPKDRFDVWRWIIWSNVFFVIALVAYVTVANTKFVSGLFLSFIAFIFFALLYSAKPIRARTIPVIDSLFSAGHYISTAVFAFYLLAENPLPTDPLLSSLAHINWWYVIAGVCFAFVLHAYSAIRDIDADKLAGIKTTPILFGAKVTSFLCLILCTICGTIIYLVDPGLRNGLIALLMTPYAFIMIQTFNSASISNIKDRDKRINQHYKLFVVLNGVIGFLLVWILILLNFF